MSPEIFAFCREDTREQIVGALAEAAERDASMLRRALNDAESALGAELKKTDRLERALREISRNIAENLPMTGLDAHINAIAAAALAQIKGGKK